MATLKTIGSINNSMTSEFQQAVFLNDAAIAYETLDELLDAGWYPENAQSEWTDISVLDGKYYACFGEDSVMANDAKLIYVEIVPTENMKKELEYFKQGNII